MILWERLNILLFHTFLSVNKDEHWKHVPPQKTQKKTIGNTALCSFSRRISKFWIISSVMKMWLSGLVDWPDSRWGVARRYRYINNSKATPKIYYSPDIYIALHPYRVSKIARCIDAHTIHCKSARFKVCMTAVWHSKHIYIHICISMPRKRFTRYN